MKAQLLQIADTDGEAIPVLKAFDDYEEFNPVAPKASKFIRRYVRLADPDLLGRAGAATSSTPSAWVYVFNGDTALLPRIQSGDWRDHRAKRDSGIAPSGSARSHRLPDRRSFGSTCMDGAIDARFLMELPWQLGQVRTCIRPVVGGR